MPALIPSALHTLRRVDRRWSTVTPTQAAALLVGLTALTGAVYRIFGWRGLTAILVGLALACFPHLPGSRALQRLAVRRGAAIALVSLVALLVSAGLSARRLPQPWIHDEFCYLLMADTFASGRLTNPTHPMWEHFESFHIIHQPTYASKYPPAQGLVLAAGQVLTGLPIAGVWASFALACAAACWMLQGWTRPRWAFFGGLLAAVHPGFHAGSGPFSWTQTYWGGAVPMLGSALLFGALPRILRRPRVADGFMMGLGLAVLANSRPYEGLVASLPVGLALLWRLLRPGPYSPLTFAVRVLAPIAVVLGLAAAAMGYYNWRVTGRPLTMPYQVHERTYAVAPALLWGQPGQTPEYRHEVMRRFHIDWDLGGYAKLKTVAGWFRHYGPRLRKLLGFFVGPFIIPALMLPIALRSGPMRFAALTCVLVLVADLLTQGLQPHYLAPVAALYLLLVVTCFRHLCVLRLGRLRVGRALAIVTIVLAVLSTAFRYTEQGWWLDRARLEAQLEAAQGKHLVIVRYAPDHDVLEEWVYNRADIDGSRVVWAREMGPAPDAKLLSYFRDRKAWLLEADAKPPKLRQYPVD
jgi:hypothetical protein